MVTANSSTYKNVPVSDRTSTSKVATSQVLHEHGPYRNGIMPIADLEFLSHADVFIGSADDRVDPKQSSHLSTFSLLVASLVSTNERNSRRIQSQPDHNTLTHAEEFIRWLPSCGTRIIHEQHSIEHLLC